jgi:hypothetical protein
MLSFKSTENHTRLEIHETWHGVVIWPLEGMFKKLRPFPMKDIGFKRERVGFVKGVHGRSCIGLETFSALSWGHGMAHARPWPFLRHVCYIEDIYYIYRVLMPEIQDMNFAFKPDPFPLET